MGIKDKLNQSKSFLATHKLSNPEEIAFTLKFDGTNRVINITHAEVLQLTVDAIDDKKITELDPITGSQLDGNDVLAVADISEDETKKITADELFVAFLRDGVDELRIGDIHILDNRIENGGGGVDLVAADGFSINIEAANITGGSITGTTIGGIGDLASDGTFNNLTILPGGTLTVASIDNVSINPSNSQPGNFTTLGLTGDLTSTANATFVDLNVSSLTSAGNITAPIITANTNFSGNLGVDGGTNNNAAYVTDLKATGTSTLTVLDAASFFINTTEVTATAAELNLLDGALAGQAIPSKAVIYDDQGYIQANEFKAGTVGNLIISDASITTAAGALTINPITDLILNPGGRIELQSDTVLTSGTFEAQNFFASSEMRAAGSFVLGTNDATPINYLQILIDSQNPVIRNPSQTGTLKIQAHETYIQSEDGSEEIAFFEDGGPVRLNFDNVKRFETSNTGANLFGNVSVAAEGSNAGDFQAAGRILSTVLGGTALQSANASVLDFQAYGNTILGDTGSDSLTVNGTATFEQLITANNSINMPAGCITMGPDGTRRLSICYTDSQGARDTVQISLSQPSDPSMKAPLQVSTDTLNVITNSGSTVNMMNLTYDRVSLYQQGREFIFTRSENIPGEGLVDTAQFNGNLETTGDINTQHVDMATGFLSRGRSQIEGHDLEIEESSARIQLIDNTVITDKRTAYISNAVDSEVTEVGTSLTFEANGAKQTDFVSGAGRVKFKAGGIQVLDLDYIRQEAPLVVKNFTQLRNRVDDEDIVISPTRNLVASTPTFIQQDDNPVLVLMDSRYKQEVVETSTRSTWSGALGNITLNSDPSGLVDNSQFELLLGGESFFKAIEGTNSGVDLSSINLSIHDQDYITIQRRQSGEPLSVISLVTDSTNGNGLDLVARSATTSAGTFEVRASTADYMQIVETFNNVDGKAFFSTHVEMPSDKELRIGNEKEFIIKHLDANNRTEISHTVGEQILINGEVSSGGALQPAARFTGGEQQVIYGKSDTGSSIAINPKLETNNTGVGIVGKALIIEDDYLSTKPTIVLNESAAPNIKTVFTQDSFTFKLQTESGNVNTDRFLIYNQEKTDLGYAAGIKEFRNGDTHFLADGNEYRMLWDESAGRLGVGMRWNPTAATPVMDTPAAKVHIQESVSGVATGLRIDNSASGQNRYTTGIRFKLGQESNDTAHAPKAAMFFRGDVDASRRSYGRGSIHWAVNNDGDDTEVGLNDIKMTLTEDGSFGVGTEFPYALITAEGRGEAGSEIGIGIKNTGDPGSNTSFLKLTNSNSEFKIFTTGNGPLSIQESDFNEIGKQRFFLEDGNILLNVPTVNDSVFTTAGAEGNIQIIAQSNNNDIANFHILSQIIETDAIRRVITFETNHSSSSVNPKRVAGHIRTGSYDDTDANAKPPLIIGTDKFIIQNEDGSVEYASFDSDYFIVNKILVDDGAVDTPSFSFDSDRNTGIYRKTDNTLAFTTNGTLRAYLDASDNFILSAQDKTPEYPGILIAPNNANASLTLRNSTTGYEATDGVTVGLVGSDLIINNKEPTFSNLKLQLGSSDKLSISLTKIDIADDLEVAGEIETTGLEVKSDNPKILITDKADSYTHIEFETNVGGIKTFVGMEGATGGQIFTGSDPFSSVIGSYNDYPLHFFTNNSLGMTLSNSGQLAIGTKTPGADLTIYNVAEPTLRFENGAVDQPFTVLHEFVGDDYEITTSRSDGCNFRFGTMGGGVEAMRIQKDGMVSIGNVQAPDYGAGYKTLQVSGTKTGIVQTQNSTNSIITEIESEGDLGRIGTRTDHSLGIKTNQSTRLLIDSSGNVGINNTIPGQYLPGELTVGNSTKDQFISVVSGASNAAGIAFQDQTGASTIVGGIRYTHNNNNFEIWTAATKQLTIDATGRVGIGNENPDNALSIQVTDTTVISAGAEGNVVTLSNDADGGYAGIKFNTEPPSGLGNAAKASINSATTVSGTSIMTFSTETGGAYAERMRLDGQGNLGIGVNLPAHDLHTAGPIQVGNILYPSDIGELGQVLTSNGNGIASWQNTVREEGTFSPEITTSGSSFAYSLQNGFYKKVGPLVFVTGQFNVLSIGSQGTDGEPIQIGGFPFDVDGSVYSRLNLMTSRVNFPDEYINFVMYQSGTTDFRILAERDNAAWNIMQVGEWEWTVSGSNTSQFQFWGTYYSTE